MTNTERLAVEWADAVAVVYASPELANEAAVCRLIECGDKLNLALRELPAPDEWRERYERVAVAIGYGEYPEGQGGPQVADPDTIISAWNTLQSDVPPEMFDYRQDLARARASVSNVENRLAHTMRERDEARADLHLLKRAVSPSRAGHAPWEGMPDITYFVGVALRYRERDTRIRTMRVKA